MKGLDLTPLLKKMIHESDQTLKQNTLAAHFIPPLRLRRRAHHLHRRVVELVQNRENPE